MTAVTSRSGTGLADVDSYEWSAPVEVLPPTRHLSLNVRAVRAAVLVLAVFLLSLCLQLGVLSGLSQRVAQTRLFDELRNNLANGTAPIGPTTAAGHALAAGTPIALLQIPSLHLRQVVGFGASGGDLESGPGYVPNSQFPGQAGVTTIDGRAEAFGGPFGSIGRLRKGDRLVITTQVGKTVYRVIDVRKAGALLPPALGANQGRLTLVTAVEHDFIPNGVLYVDADAPAAQLAAGTAPAESVLPAAERPLGTDISDLWELIFWLQGLVLVLIGGVWAWHRWGRAKTWVVFIPAGVFFTYSFAGGVARLLPNLV